MSRWLLRVYDQLASHTEWYRRIALSDAVFDAAYFEKVERQHRELLEIAFQGDADLAVSSLMTHRKSSLDQVLTMFDDPPIE